jgi:hypothetical protein
VTTWEEVLQDGTIGGKELLGVVPGFAPLHPLLPLMGRLVEVLRTIIQIPHPSATCHQAGGVGGAADSHTAGHT